MKLYGNFSSVHEIQGVLDKIVNQSINQSISQSNFYSANIPGEARLCGAIVGRMKNILLPRFATFGDVAATEMNFVVKTSHCFSYLTARKAS